MNQVLAQLRTFYASLDARRRRLLWGALALTAIAVVAVGIWASVDSYQVVLSTDDPAAMAAATASLEDLKIPYRLSSDGRRLSVPVNQKGNATVEIANTTAVVGAELLDNLPIGTTPTRVSLAQQRALEGELTRTISSLDVVKTCRVHIVLAGDDVFLKHHSEGKAGVVLTLKPGRHLSPSQISGITSLVASAVKKLNPADVTLTDSEGNILTQTPEQDSLTAQASSLSEKRRAEETALQARVERSLVKFLGNEALFDVAVAVELDDTSSDETKTAIDPSSGVPISEQLTEETSKGERSAGVAGSESNLPEKPAPSVTGNERTSSQSQTKYEYTRVTTHVSKPAGALKRVSASVNVDEPALLALVAAGQGERTLESTRAELASSIQAAMGYDQARGDTLQLTVLPFNAEVAQAAADLAEAPLDLVRYLPYALAALVMLLVFAFVIRPMMARATQNPQLALEGVGPDGNLIAVAGGEPSEEDLPLAERLRHLVDNFEAVDARELNRLVEAQTEASTQVLRRWMRSA
ncbi:MAG: flagellar basal-body MS-ring/collar protein FliF [Pseudomonadota bacterium]